MLSMDQSDSQASLIAIASDHAGFLAKENLKEFIREFGFDVIDFGTDSENSVDYPDFAVKVAESVAVAEVDFGVLICGTGIGMSITANKISEIRAALCHDETSARLSRQHNDANILVLSGSNEDRNEIFATFANTTFEGGRHENRVKKIHKLTGR